MSPPICEPAAIAEHNSAFGTVVESFAHGYGSAMRNRTMLSGRRKRNEGGIVPIGRTRVGATALTVAVIALASSSELSVADPAAFVAGATRDCVACDLAGRDLRERDFKRAKLDQ